MSAAPELVLGAAALGQFLVSYGKSGGVGVFTADPALSLRRGDRVVVVSPRGTEAGAVLCPASIQQARLLGARATGPLLRTLSADDHAQLECHEGLAEQMFAAARAEVDRQGIALEVLDVEILLDGEHAIVHCLGDEAAGSPLAASLEGRFGLEIRLENAAQPTAGIEETAAGGCGKPDCGRGADGGCSTCSSGGGCSSCGSHVDLREYFGHLRDKMETRNRRSLA